MADETPLDAPQEFADATSYQVRGEFEEIVRRDLLGPWDGPTEQLPDGGPRDRYVVGALGPKRSTESAIKNAADLPDAEIGVSGDGSEVELPEILTPQSLGRIWASSMGLSFSVAQDIDVVVVKAEWGRYVRRQVEIEGKKRTRWFREPMPFTEEIRLDGERTFHKHLAGDEPGVFLGVSIRDRGKSRIVEISLVNAQDEPDDLKDRAWIFQSQLTVTALDGDRAIFEPIDETDQAVPDLEEAHLRLLYRSQRRYANGRNVAVHPDVRSDDNRAYKLETTWLPTYDVPATTGDNAALVDVELSMDKLATADETALQRGLQPLVDGYATWLDQRSAEVAELPTALRPAAERAIRDARTAHERITAGIELLTDPGAPRHDEALRAFHFANLVMADQRRHTTIVARRGNSPQTYGEARAVVEAQGERVASWRPFQLAFVLINLPALTDPEHSERTADSSAIVDLLFFPTGGGKTEAYLGLTAYTFAIRRLQGCIGDGSDARSGVAGVAVLMRYTLRLLTAQQFQRAAALVCAAEVRRQEDESTWGAEPFRIGLWVGAGVSPNWFSDAEEQINAAHQAGSDRRTNVLQTLVCPWCGTQLRGHRDLHPNLELRRVYLYCANGEGSDACPFARRNNPEGLPILTVDEEIYRYAPSLVIATVDKLAQLPWRGFAGMLFGRVAQRCPRHGYRHPDLDRRTNCRGRHTKKGSLPAVVSRPVPRLRPPDLIIQDELHLISGALGTTVGLFEAAVDQLCTWKPSGDHETGPKIVASTATTKRAREQTLGVFGRDLAVFPPQVIDVADTYFSRQVAVTPETPGRRYLGVCAHGVRLKSAEIRLAEILLIAGQTMFDRYGKPADPYMTTVGYFNATRELAGMRRYLDDDVTTRVRTHGHARALSDRLIGSAMLNISELTSRISSADISEALKRLEIGFDTELDTSARRRGIADDRREVYRANRGKSLRSKDRLTYHPLSEQVRERADAGRHPADVVLATSMLQVGVDVSRFGLMVVTGQPKNTAEYIQASSRVGRGQDRPGLVVTLYNWSRPRDLAHYEDFEHYHATFYRQVEALSVTPFTRRALDRGTMGTFVAAVRNIDEANSANNVAQDVNLDSPAVAGIVARFLRRAESVAGQRGRDYFAERINVVKDRWNKAKTGSVRLGYRTVNVGNEQVVGLLENAGAGRWSDTTVSMSMRETENEINLLVPGGGEIFVPTYNAPVWSFASRGTDPDEDTPDGDEFGTGDGAE